MKFVLDIFEIKMDTMIFMRLFLHPTKKNYFKVKYFKGSPDPAILFMKSMSERGGSDIERLRIGMTSSSIHFEPI